MIIVALVTFDAAFSHSQLYILYVCMRERTPYCECAAAQNIWRSVPTGVRSAVHLPLAAMCRSWHERFVAGGDHVWRRIHARLYIGDAARTARQREGNDAGQIRNVFRLATAVTQQLQLLLLCYARYVYEIAFREYRDALSLAWANAGGSCANLPQTYSKTSILVRPSVV